MSSATEQTSHGPENTAGERCSASVRDAGSSWPRYHQCSKTASTVEDGKPYCKIHSPKEIAAKRAAKKEAFEEKWQREKRRKLLEMAAPDLLEALKAILSEGATGFTALNQEYIRDNDRTRTAIIKARAAIAKAEGR